MKNKIEYPFYEAEIKTSGCAIELLVNGVPSFSNYKEGGMAVDWPINEMILKSGRQLFSFVVRRSDGEEHINDNAMIDFKIFVRDAFYNEEPRQLLFELPEKSFKGKNLDKYSFNHFFDAIVPYELEGWKNSTNIVNEDKKKLLNELIDWNDKFLNIFKNKKEEEYLKITNTRFEELSRAFYLDNDSKKMNKSRMFSSIHSSVKKIPLKEYELSFFGNGKLVGVRLPKESYGFKFESLEKEKPDFTELALFHRPKEGELLEVIR